MVSRQQLLSSIQPGMKLTKNFFMRIYGYELTWPGSADQALSELERAGCSKARAYYQQFVGEYEKDHDAAMKNVAVWYRKQVDDEFERREMKLRKQQEVEQQKQQSWNQLSEILGYQ